MQGAIARHKIATFPPDILIEIPKNSCQFMDFDLAEKMIELGYNETDQKMC